MQKRRLHPGLHLLWTIPVAAASWELLQGLANLTACGWNLDCFPGGSGLHVDKLPEVAFYCAAAGFILFFCIALVPWHRRWTPRLIVASVAALLVAVLGFLWAIGVV